MATLAEGGSASALTSTLKNAIRIPPLCTHGDPFKPTTQMRFAGTHVAQVHARYPNPRGAGLHMTARSPPLRTSLPGCGPNPCIVYSMPVTLVATVLYGVMVVLLAWFVVPRRPLPHHIAFFCQEGRASQKNGYKQ